MREYVVGQSVLDYMPDYFRVCPNLNVPIRKQAEDVIIAASGTSCRHQIKDRVGRRALHTAEILYEALA